MAALIAYAFKWNWVAVIFVVSAIGNLIPNKNLKKKANKKKSNFTPADLPTNTRTKLKTATKLKKSDLPAAIAMLREAYNDGEAISLDEFLRLPNYLRMNKQYDEAFQECRKLAHHGFFESETPGSPWWYRDQAKILRLEAKICEEEGNYRDALSTRVLIYYYDIKHAEGISKSTVHEGTNWSENLQEKGLRDLELLLSNHADWTPNFEKLLDNLGHKNKRQEAISLVAVWASSWPNEPEVLVKSIDELLWPNT